VQEHSIALSARVGRCARLVVIALLGGLAAGAPRALDAQLAPPLQLELTAGIGALQPGTDLVRRSDLPGGALQLGGSFALGGTASIQLPGGLGVEGQALWSPRMALEDPGGTHEGHANWLALTLAAVYRPPLPVLGKVFQPFLGAGLGVRRLTPYPDAVALPVVLGAPAAPLLADSTGRSDFVAEGLVGTYVGLPGLWKIRVELRDYVTSFSDSGDARLQNDIALLGAVVVRVP